MAASKRPADDIDAHVGARIRSRRKALELSQEQLAGAIGVTFQQVQKYERGFNRISASALYRAAQFLAVEPQWFFDDLPGKPVVDPVLQLAGSPQGRALAEAWAAIASGTHRELVVKLARALKPRTQDEAAQAA